MNGGFRTDSFFCGASPALVFVAQTSVLGQLGFEKKGSCKPLKSNMHKLVELRMVAVTGWNQKCLVWNNNFLADEILIIFGRINEVA